MSARRIASVLHNGSRSDPLPRLFQPPAVTARQQIVVTGGPKLHKAQTQRFRAVSSASALYPEHPSVSRPSRAAPDLRPVIEAAPNSGYSDYLPSCSVGGRRVQ